MLFMCKSADYPHLIPASISKLFTEITNQYTETLSERLVTQVNSMFIKGIRLYGEVLGEATEANAPLPTHSLVGFKNKLKTYLIAIQSLGNSNEWDPENFRLCIQRAKRKSPRLDITISTHLLTQL